MASKICRACRVMAARNITRKTYQTTDIVAGLLRHLEETNLSITADQTRSFEFFCADCHRDLLPTIDYYMVRRKLWAKACATTPIISPNAMLCMPCLSDRLGRPLVREDFPKNIPINNGEYWFDRRRVPAGRRAARKAA
jgi:hypothetical protein